MVAVPTQADLQLMNVNSMAALAGQQAAAVSAAASMAAPPAGAVIVQPAVIQAPAVGEWK